MSTIIFFFFKTIMKGSPFIIAPKKTIYTLL